MNEFAVYLVPICVALIVLFGFFKRVPVFDAFLSGAKEGFSSTIEMCIRDSYGLVQEEKAEQQEQNGKSITDFIPMQG